MKCIAYWIRCDNFELLWIAAKSRAVQIVCETETVNFYVTTLDAVCPNSHNYGNSRLYRSMHKTLIGCTKPPPLIARVWATLYKLPFTISRLLWKNRNIQGTIPWDTVIYLDFKHAMMPQFEKFGRVRGGGFITFISQYHSFTQVQFSEQTASIVVTKRTNFLYLANGLHCSRFGCNP